MPAPIRRPKRSVRRLAVEHPVDQPRRKPIAAAQVLLTHSDLSERERYLNVDSKGVLSFPPEQLAAGMKRAHDGGWQVAVHANGVSRNGTIIAW